MLATPDWLKGREGELCAGLNERTILVVLNNQPQYRLVATPAHGKFTCVVTQTNNGKRLDQSKDYNSIAEALAGGLEELRSKLGW